jgi:hypothetical protein
MSKLNQPPYTEFPIKKSPDPVPHMFKKLIIPSLRSSRTAVSIAPLFPAVSIFPTVYNPANGIAFEEGTHKLGINYTGRMQMYRNTTQNKNSWLEIDLEGNPSNRDGIGAKVFLKAGCVTQIRENKGGIHKHTQDARRLHFGLGESDVIERIEVIWPSEIKPVLKSVQPNQIQRIKES